MRTLLENKLAFGATLLAFVLATGLTAVYGQASPNEWPEAMLLADDPSLPPDPWCPSCPPPKDGAETLLAMDDPSLPPDPWCPSCPPPKDGAETLLAMDDP